jgi:hypothetical protein
MFTNAHGRVDCSRVAAGSCGTLLGPRRLGKRRCSMRARQTGCQANDEAQRAEAETHCWDATAKNHDAEGVPGVVAQRNVDTGAAGLCSPPGTSRYADILARGRHLASAERLALSCEAPKERSD